MDDIFIPFLARETIVQNKTTHKTNIIQSPWLQSNTIKSSTNTNTPPLVKLHNEILQFCDFIYPTQKELEIRESLISQLTNIATSLFPNCELKVFGSQYTRMLTSTSDIDISIINVSTSATDCDNSEGVTEVDCLYKLASKLKELRIVSYVEVIANAKVPIIKLDHLDSKISVDICINNTSGFDTGTYIHYKYIYFTYTLHILYIYFMYIINIQAILSYNLYAHILR